MELDVNDVCWETGKLATTNLCIKYCSVLLVGLAVVVGYWPVASGYNVASGTGGVFIHTLSSR